MRCTTLETGKDRCLMGELIIQIDIEIEACERAIRNAYSVREVDALTNRVKELIKKRFVAYNSKHFKEEK
tara:strand:- start:1340 stop:1549 length:210 start_codon:yes stop_codon:yes gene_type:complete